MEPTLPSTTEAARVCMNRQGRAYCGRSLKPHKSTVQWADVVCADCEAAYRADRGAPNER